MAPQSKGRFWRRFRLGFRCFRIGVLLVCLALVCALVYLSEVGLPDFVKRPLIEKLRERGVELQFSNLRLRWFHGVVARNVRFGSSNEQTGPRLSAQEAEINLNPDQLLHFHLQVDGVGLHHGRFDWPVGDTNAPGRALSVTNIEAQLQLLPGDQWSLDDFRANFAGGQFTLSAAISNASAIREWKLLKSRQPSRPRALPGQLQHLADTLEKISFSEPPNLRLVVAGDGRDPQSFSARLICNADEARTPWGSIEQMLLTAKLIPASTNGPSHVRLNLEAAGLFTDWGGGRGVQFAAELTPVSDALPADPTWAWWTNLQPYALEWELNAKELRSEKLDANTVQLAGRWHAPELTVTNLYAEWSDGTVQATARLNVATRATEFSLVSDAEPHRVWPLLTEKTRHWLSKFSWATPPHLRGSGSVTLPAWTDRHPDWRGEVQPTLCLAGEFSGTNVAYLDVPADWAHSHFTYTNMLWHLPDLQVHRPEGLIQSAYEANDRTRDYHWQLRGPIDPCAVYSLLSSNEQRGLDLFSFSTPPFFDGDIWGRLYEHERIGFRGRVALTNFVVRNQVANLFVAEVQYTNRLLELFEPRLWRGDEVLAASGIRADFLTDRIYFTNGFSTAEPMAVARAIGPRTAEAVERYQFTEPPTVRVSGYAPLKGDRDADLHFAIDGGPFVWWKFHAPHVKGGVIWQGQTVILTNVQASFYGGDATGDAFFDFQRDHQADFNFSLNVADANLQLLMADLTTKSNRLEGQLGGWLIITNANTGDKHSWQGYGRTKLRDGFIWEIPIFGVLSPVLDSIIPGVGNTRATEGSAEFAITNGVLFADRLEIKSPMVRLQYSGSVDFDGYVDARVTAEPLRDAWLVGPLLNLVLTPVSKLFEYKITGTFEHPKSDPVYIPKLLFIPFRPFRTLDEIFSGGSNRTNAPPAEFAPGEKQ